MKAVEDGGVDDDDDERVKESGDLMAPLRRVRFFFF